MAKPANLGVASRFALLKIDDDDEDDGGFNVQNNKSKKSTAQGGKTKFVPIGGGAKVVANNPPPTKPKKKNAKKGKTAEFGGSDKDGDSDEEKQLKEALRLSRMSQEAEDEQRRQLSWEEDEGTKIALEESLNGQPTQEGAAAASVARSVPFSSKARVTGSAPPPAVRPKKETEHPIVKEASNEEDGDGVGGGQMQLHAKSVQERAQKIISKQNGTGAGDNALINLYKQEFEAMTVLMAKKEIEMEKLKGDLDKAKHRAKRVLEVLNEAESREKAELIVSRDDMEKVNRELMQQVTGMNTELEQARSRIHELEGELKKIKSAAAR